MFRNSKNWVITFCPLEPSFGEASHSWRSWELSPVQPSGWLSVLFTDLLPSHVCFEEASHEGHSCTHLCGDHLSWLRALNAHQYPFALLPTAVSPRQSGGFLFHTMANAFQGSTYLTHFDFELYNTVKFCQFDVVQQWNACQGHINQLSVQILEMEIYEGPEKNTVEYKKLLWQATNLRFWYKLAATAIQVWMWQVDVSHQHVHVWFHSRCQHGQVAETARSTLRLSDLNSAPSTQWSWRMEQTSSHLLLWDGTLMGPLTLNDTSFPCPWQIRSICRVWNLNLRLSWKLSWLAISAQTSWRPWQTSWGNWMMGSGRFQLPWTACRGCGAFSLRKPGLWLIQRLSPTAKVQWIISWKTTGGK